MTLAAGTPQLSTTRLGVSLVLSLIVLILLVTVTKLHPFISLLAAALVVGIGSGYGPVATITSFSSEFGKTMGSVGILIGLGAMIGRVLMDTGATDQVVNSLVSKASDASIPWIMALIGALIGLPMFFEVGLVVLVPVIILVARRTKLPLMRVAIPTLAGLSIMHACVPPHPGPLAALSQFKTGGNIGLTMMFGIPIAIVTLLIVGPLFSKIAAKWVPVQAPADFVTRSDKAVEQEAKLPPFGLSLCCILLPAALMLLTSIFEIASPGFSSSTSGFGQVINFVGNPIMALAISLIFAMLSLKAASGIPWKTVNDSLGAALPPVAGILLIVGGGGGFKGVLVSTGIGQIIGNFVESSHVSIFLLGWLIAAFVRIATGSATVSILTTAGILSNAMAMMNASPSAVTLLVLAIGAGSIFLSHLNDAGFWLIKEYFSLSVGETLKSWSVLECLLSVVVLALVMLLSIFVPLTA
ncbi:gluconate permease [Bifidobacterium actinocoloniiforme DSM 22766]|uniref:Gluconate permease n=2 Tax=Bifidobacterium actinocoloniiforme TaxID=638619 RepID=A0A086YYF3_9BIFI|nr:gluconate:H+ symporter [Bifidobacterium actinocoloniiforme]AKV55853.1 gluconate transporter [Bifidobacterium actinocoloniiforme DSM 22766]KFI39303.1 gluconate permease [Bifidobacterium actinocoloniiforme DSM 22766]